MMRSNSAHSFRGLESLEDRCLMSGDLASVVNQAKAQLSAGASALLARLQDALLGESPSSSSSKDSSTKTQPAPKTLGESFERLRYNAQLLGASNAALAQAIKQAGQPADVAAGYEAGLRVLVADGLALPAEALKTNLTASELLKHVGDLQIVGGQDQQSSTTYWNDVRVKGVDAALAGVVTANLGIPAAAVVGKKAQEILADSANIQLMTGDVRSIKAWQGLALVKAGKINVDQYAKDYTDASDVKDGAGQNAANNNVQPTTPAVAREVKNAVGNVAVDRAVNGNGGTGNGSGGGNGGNATAGTNTQPAPAQDAQQEVDSNMPAVTNTPPPSQQDTSSNTSQTDNAHVGTITNVQNSSDGTSSYTLTESYPDGHTTTSQVTVHPDGSATVVHGDGSETQLPAGSADPMPAEAEGQTIPMGQDTNGDGEADSGTYTPSSGDNGDGSDDGDDDDDDDDDDNNGDNADTAPPAESQGDDSGGGGDSAPAASGEPTPDADTSDPQKKNDFYQNNPIGRSVAGSMDPTKGPTGGAGDPEDPGTNPAARQAFENSPLGAKGKGVRVPGGAIDYPDGERSTSIVVDARQLAAIAIRAGGAVGGPEAGKPVTVGSGANTGGGVIPATPIKGGGTTSASTSATVSTTPSAATFSTVRISTSVSSAAISAKVSTAVFAK
jgi:hypothetical protein